MMSGSLATTVARAAERRPGRAALVLVVPGLQWAAVAVLVSLAALLRLPNLQTIPELTDEIREVLWSLQIARGQSFPLTNFDAYDGAFYNYVLAAVLRLFGADPRVPRVAMLWFGVLTVALVFVCIRRAHGPLAAGLAAAMLVVSPVHVLANSRVAWGNGLTPLLTTLGFWLVYRAVTPSSDLEPGGGDRRGGGLFRDPSWNLLPAGLLLGLALQTHPSVLVVLPGVAVACALMRPGLLRSRWPWLAGLGVALGYGNMLVFNLTHSFESVRVAQQTRADYTGAAPDIGREYLASLGTLLLGLFRMLGGAVEDRAGPQAFLADPLLQVAALLTLAGLIWAARRGDWLPLSVALSTVLLLPAVNDRYEPILDGRYLAPALPLIYGAAGGLLVGLWTAARPRRARIAGRVVCLLGLVALLAAPLVGLARYTQQNAGIALRSARHWTAFGLAEQYRPPGSEIVLDRDLERAIRGAGSTELLAFEYAFTMHDVPHRIVRVTPSGLVALLAEGVGPGESRLVVMERAKRKLLDSRLRVRQLDDEDFGRGERPSAHGVYLVRWQAGGG